MTNPFVGNDLRTSSQQPTNPFRGNEVRGPDLTPELEVVTAQAEKSNPERTARALDLSRRTQLPADVVERNLDEVERLAGTRTFDPGQFASEYPTTARWLTNPTNAAVAKDDYENLGSLERIVGKWQMPRLRDVLAGISGGPTAFGLALPLREQAGLVEESFRQGQVGIQLARLYANTTPAQRNDPAVRDRIAALRGELRELPESEGIAERALRSAAGGFLPSMLDIGVASAVGGAAGAIAGGAAGALGGPVAGVTAGAGAIVGAAAGGFNAARELWSGEMARTLDELRDERGNPLNAGTQEVIKHTFGVLGGAFEIAGLGIIGRQMGKAVGMQAVARGVERGMADALRQQGLGRIAIEAGKTYATAVGVETAEETLSEGLALTGEAVARYIGNVQGGDFSPVEQEAERLMATAVETFYGSLVLGGLAAGGQSIVGLAQYQQAEAEAQRFAAMVGVADASKLRQRDPISFANVVNEQLRASGNPETVGVPAERMVMLLQEQNVPLEQFAEQAGVTPEAVQDAAAAGQDVMLPVANLLANLTTTPVFQAMQEDIRFRVGLPTLREAREAEANLADELESVRKEVEAAVTETPEGSVQRIVEDITAQVTAASATLPKSADYTPDNIKAMAEGAAAFYKVMAGRQGVDPYDLYRRRNYRIVGPEQAADIFAQRGGLAQVQPVTREEADTYYAREAHDLRARFPDWSARDIAENMVAAVRQVEGWLSQPKPEMTPEAENSVMLRLAFGPMLNQAAFHGSPYVFDRFDLSRIGTGEGAQAYGWGLYFAENPKTAEGYQKTLSLSKRDTAGIVASVVPDWSYQAKSEMQLLAVQDDVWPTAKEAAYQLVARVSELREGKEGSIAQMAAEYEPLMQEVRDRIKAESGALYRVDIPDEAVARMLDWDKPLSEQAPEVREALKKAARSKTEGGRNVKQLLIDEKENADIEVMTGDAFYDKLSYALGDSAENASKYLASIGIPGIKYLDAGSRGTGDGTRNLVVFDDALVTITHRNGEPVTAAERADFLAQGGADPNAFIIPGVSQTTIGLMRTANLSSVLHELSHDWLLIVRDDAMREDASEQVKQDWATITQYLGLPESGEISVEAQEKWARTWERYAATADAPSRGLARAFVRFKSWMARVYRQVREMLMPVDPAIADVFDRLLATEDELRAVRRQNATEPLVASDADAETLGMTPEQYREYAKGWQLDEAEQNAALLKDLLAERSDEMRKVKREAETRIRGEVEAEFAGIPVYQTIRYLTTGEIPPGVQMVGGEKLNREAVEVAFGAGIARTLPRGIFTDEGGIDADALALAFGFRDGFAVIEAMQQAAPEKQAVGAEVRRRMAMEFPDPMQNSAVLNERAQDAAHRATTDDPIVRDLTVLSRAAGIRPPNVPAVKRVAREMVSAMVVKDIRPVAYQNAEATAARKSGEAFKAGNLERAAFHKRQQLVNHILYREAKKAQERQGVIERFAKRMQKRSTQERLGRAGMAYQNAMNAVMASYGFIPSFSVGKTAALTAFTTEAVEVAGAVPAIPQVVAERDGQTSIRDIPMAELDAVYSAMQQVYQVAAQTDRALQDGEKRTISEIEAQVVASIADKHELSPRNIDSYPLSLANAKQKLAAIDAWHLPPEFLFVWLDGDTTGAAYNAFLKPFALAEADEFRRGEAAFKEMQRIEQMIDLPPWALDRSQAYRGIRTRMTKRAILSLALNMGTRSGVEATLAAQVDGVPQFGSYADIQAMFAQTLTEKDWAYIQAKWDYANSFWPEIAELERVTNGIVPQKLEAEPFAIRTADGKDIIVKGGYYPLKYDTQKLGIGGALRDARTSITTDESTIMSVGAARAQTLHGWTEEREKASGRPLSLDLNVWNAHIVNVIHDLTHRKAVRDVVRLYQRKEMRQAIEQSAGQEAYNSLKFWLARIANPNQVFDSSPVEKTFAHARAGVTMVNMGLSVGVSMIQPLGYLQSADVIGPKWLAQGIIAAYSPSWKSIAGAAVGGAAYGATLGPLGAGLGAGFGAFVGGLAKQTEFVLENSVAMRQRREDFNRDARDYARTRQGKFSNFDRFYFSFIGMMDNAVMVPTWIGGYRRAMAENGGNHDAAVQFADSAVRRSQGAGSPKDLSRIQGGPELRRMLTVHYSFLSRQYGLVRRSGTNLVEGRWSVARTMASLTAIVALSQILSELVAGRGPDEEDDESWVSWAVAETLRAAFSPIVFVRDIARAIGPDAYQYKLSPVVDAISKTVGAMNTMLESVTEDDFEMSESEAKEIVETIGYWGKLPTRAVWRAVTAWLRWDEGYDVPAADFIRTPSR